MRLLEAQGWRSWNNLFEEWARVYRTSKDAGHAFFLALAAAEDGGSTGDEGEGTDADVGVDFGSTRGSVCRCRGGKEDEGESEGGIEQVLHG
jgi:hypothetical protein